MNDLVAAMNDKSEAQGPGALIIRLVSLLATMKGKIQTLEQEAQRSHQSDVRSKLATISATQIQEAGVVQKENISSKETQMRQNVIPILKLQIQSLTSKIQCDSLEIKQLIAEKEQLTRDLAILKHQMLEMVSKSAEKGEEHPESAAIRKESVAQSASAMTTKRIESLTRRMQVLEDTVATCKQIVEQQQPAHNEYKTKFSELMRASTELNEAVITVSAKRADEQKLYISALDSINKSERERESLHHSLAQSQCKLTETMQELALAKEKSTSAWDEASKSIFLLDEQSQKIEELSDQMKELKAYYSICKQPALTTAPLDANSLENSARIDRVEANSSLNFLGPPEIVSSTILTPNRNEIEMKPSESQVDVASGIRDTHEPCTSTQTRESSDLSSINVAAKILAASNPDLLVGQRINSRQAAASRVSFDDSSGNGIYIPQMQPLFGEPCINPLTSNMPSTSEPALENN